MFDSSYKANKQAIVHHVMNHLINPTTAYLPSQYRLANRKYHTKRSVIALSSHLTPFPPPVFADQTYEVLISTVLAIYQQLAVHLLFLRIVSYSSSRLHLGFVGHSVLAYLY